MIKVEYPHRHWDLMLPLFAYSYNFHLLDNCKILNKQALQMSSYSAWWSKVTRMSSEHPHFIILRISGGAAAILLGIPICINLPWLSPFDPPYVKGSMSGGLEFRLALHIAACKCALKTCCSKTAFVGGSIMSCGAEFSLLFAILQTILWTSMHWCCLLLGIHSRQQQN